MYAKPINVLLIQFSLSHISCKTRIFSEITLQISLHGGADSAFMQDGVRTNLPFPIHLLLRKSQFRPSTRHGFGIWVNIVV
jgi:hypothetical protein